MSGANEQGGREGGSPAESSDAHISAPSGSGTAPVYAAQNSLSSRIIGVFNGGGDFASGPAPQRLENRRCARTARTGPRRKASVSVR